MKIALFLPNWLGDLVMATPAVRAVRERFGGEARLIGILRPNLCGLLDGTGWLDEEWPFNPHAKPWHGHLGRVATRAGSPCHLELGNTALWRRLRRERPDVVLMLTGSLRPALIARLAGVPRRVGYDRSGRGLLLTTRVPVERRDGRIVPTPMVEYYLKLVEHATLQGNSVPPAATGGLGGEWSRRLELALTDDDRRAADAVWRRLGLRDDGRVVALNSSGAYGAAKLWPAEHFARLARLVVDELDHDVLVICGPGDQERRQSREIARWAGRDRVFSLADQPLGLATSKGCLARCRAAVSTDSGPRHVAAALGVPVVTLLGPTLPAWIENPTVRGVSLQANVDCLGCGCRVCPLGHHHCMTDLLPETVFEHVARLCGGAVPLATPKGTAP